MTSAHARRRRVLLSTAGALSIAAAFVFGFLSGRVGRVAPGSEAHSGGLVAEAADRLRAAADTDVSQDELEEAAIRGMLTALGDRYATYYDTSDYAQFQRLLDGRYSGVGLWLGRAPSGALEVTSVVPDSPAELAGLRVGDVLVDVAGLPVDGVPVGDVVRRMHGAAGSTVSVAVRREGRVRSFVLRRADLVSKDVTYDVVTSRVGRIQVAAFTRGSGREVAAALRALREKGVNGVVLDLRGNPGGLLEEGVGAASAFLDGGSVVTYKGRGVDDKTYDVLGKGDTAIPVVVLVDAGTASAAEVVAGALQDRNRAIVVGSRTYGKGSVQQPIVLSDGSAIEVTVATYYTPSGRSVDRVGIVPDVDLPPGYDARAALRRAVEVLAGTVASIPAPRG
ncbi:MAG TPA: S41 family peptidase [Mycobacteriales bacterium]|nr:S41 family peptidase [Mycobacteriales bacterium]